MTATWAILVLLASTNNATIGTTAASSASSAASQNLGAIAITLLSASLTAFAGYYAARARAKTSRVEIQDRLEELERRLSVSAVAKEQQRAPLTLRRT